VSTTLQTTILTISVMKKDVMAHIVPSDLDFCQVIISHSLRCIFLHLFFQKAMHNNIIYSLHKGQHHFQHTACGLCKLITSNKISSSNVTVILQFKCANSVNYQLQLFTIKIGLRVRIRVCLEQLCTVK